MRLKPTFDAGTAAKSAAIPEIEVDALMTLNSTSPESWRGAHHFGCDSGGSGPAKASSKISLYQYHRQSEIGLKSGVAVGY